MKRSKKITIFVVAFFLIIALIIGGRFAIGQYFKAKFGKRMPPGVIVKIVEMKNFNKTLESYCTSLPSQTISFKLKKNELLVPIEINKEVKKGDVIASLQSKKITAPFNGIIGTRGISGSSLGSTNTIMLTLDDTKRILCDLSIPEKFSSLLKKNLRVKAKFSAYKDKIYEGKIESVASRVSADTRSILARAQINNENLENIVKSFLKPSNIRLTVFPTLPNRLSSFLNVSLTPVPFLSMRATVFSMALSCFSIALIRAAILPLSISISIPTL